MMFKYCEIQNGVVTYICLDAPFIPNINPSVLLIVDITYLDPTPKVGWLYRDDKFTPNEV